MSSNRKTKVTIIKNKMFDEDFLCRRRAQFPNAHRNMLRMDYEDAKAIASELDAIERDVVLKQLSDAYARAVEFLDKK